MRISRVGLRSGLYSRPALIWLEIGGDRDWFYFYKPQSPYPYILYTYLSINSIQYFHAISISFNLIKDRNL